MTLHGLLTKATKRPSLKDGYVELLMKRDYAYFVTLTYPGGAYWLSQEHAKRDLKHLHNRLSKMLFGRQRKLGMLAVIESGIDGLPHLHILVQPFAIETSRAPTAEIFETIIVDTWRSMKHTAKSCLQHDFKRADPNTRESLLNYCLKELEFRRNADFIVLDYLN